MPPNETVDTPAARGPEVRKSVILAFQFFSFVPMLFPISAFQLSRWSCGLYFSVSAFQVFSV